MREVFIETDEFGALYIEQELVVGIEPVLFVCKNSDGARFLFMTYDSFSCDYVFCRADEKGLIDMLRNNVTIENVYRLSEFIYETSYSDESVLLKKFSAETFPADKLPLKDEFYELESEEINQYISILSKEQNTYRLMVDYEMVPVSKQSEALEVEYYCGNNFENDVKNDISSYIGHSSAFLESEEFGIAA